MTRPRYQTRIITLLFMILVMTSAACAQSPFRNSYDETIPNNVPLPTVTPPASNPDQMEHIPLPTPQPLVFSVLQTAEPSTAVPLPAEPSTADISPNEIPPVESPLPIDSIVPSDAIIPLESPLPAPTEYVPVSSIHVSPSHLDESFAQAMRADFVQDIANYADSMPRYHLRFHIHPAEGILEGRALIEFPNTTGAPLDSVVLRLYPNFPRDAFGNGGNTRIDVGNVNVAGQPALKSYLAGDTAIMIPFSIPLQSGNWTLLEIEFTATFVPWEDGNWPLPSYYPMLAVYDHTTATWRMDVTEFVDRVFAESAFYSAEITIPSHLTLLASGKIVDTQLHDHGTTTYHVRTGPMREFAMVVGNLVSVQMQGGDTGDVTVTVYKVAGSDLDIDQVAYVAATSIANYDRRYGRYPFSELDAYVLRGGYRGGWEYPGMFLLSCETHIDEGRRYVTAHEVSHQWWYNAVGNDVYRHPWLDEALAQYSGIIYAEDVAGADVASSDWEREVTARYQLALASGDLPIGWGIHDYPNFDVYFYTVYGKGAVFMRMLRAELGDDAFFGALQRYYSQNRYRIGQPHQLQQAFEEASGRDLQGLFTSWVYGH